MSAATRRGLLASSMAMAFAFLAAPAASQEDALPFGATVLVIELADNDIELQIFADAVEWTRLMVSDPNERTIFEAKAAEGLETQGGMSEMFWASEPTHYLQHDPNFDEPVEGFLERFPEGQYKFKAMTPSGREVEGEASLTHVLPALPEIVSPVSDTKDPPVVDPNNLVIDWEPVTTRFTGDGPVEIFEYQVVLEQARPKREAPWVDGPSRSALINLPPSVTALTVPPEFLSAGTSYEFEILAIEVSGNSAISEGKFQIE